jgi:hypothetical protein
MQTEPAVVVQCLWAVVPAVGLALLGELGKLIARRTIPSPGSAQAGAP